MSRAKHPPSPWCNCKSCKAYDKEQAAARNRYLQEITQTVIDGWGADPAATFRIAVPEKNRTLLVQPSKSGTWAIVSVDDLLGRDICKFIVDRIRARYSNVRFY